MDKLLDKVKESRIVQVFSDLDDEVTVTKKTILIACGILVLSGIIIGLVVGLLSRTRRETVIIDEDGCCKKKRCCKDDDEDLFF